MTITIYYKEGSHLDYDADKVSYIESIRFVELSKDNKVIAALNLDTVESIEETKEVPDDC